MLQVFWMEEVQHNYRGKEEKLIAFGPWGGQSGYRWDDGVYTGVRQVVISWSLDGIHFIQFEYDKKGQRVWSDRHGGNSGTRTDQIKLDYPIQFLVSIGGCYGPITQGGSVIVRSLTLETNKKNYGPFGIEQGAPFSLPVSAEMVVGFHGWSSQYLDSIGIYAKLLPQTEPFKPQKIQPKINQPGNNKKVVSLGPWGGDGGTIFDDGKYSGVREVDITRSGGLVSIRVCYDQDGRVVWGNKNGGSGGLKLDKIVFDYPSEILTHITGYYESTIFRGPTIVKSITFHTNKRSYGPFGDQKGFPFSSGSFGGEIVGFHGTIGYFVHSIGIHVLQSKSSLPKPYLDHINLPGQNYCEEDLGVTKLDDKKNYLNYAQKEFGVPTRIYVYKVYQPVPYRDPLDMSTLEIPEDVLGVPKQSTLYKLGPWGGGGGKAWDDGVYTGIKQIVLTRGDFISSVQFQYIDHHGHSIWSSSHGVANDICTYHLKFDYPNEVLTNISGYYDFLVGDIQRRVIRSLTFQTNRAKYGPYGKAMGTSTYFSSGNKEVQIVGFHGRSGTFLDAIGVHIQHSGNNEQLRYPYGRAYKIQ